LTLVSGLDRAPHSHAFAAAPANGGATITRHDHIKWGIVEAATACGVDIGCEVLGIFKGCVSAAASDHLHSHRGKQGTIPDFKVRVGNNTALMDLKCIGLNTSRYINTQPAAAAKPLFAVNRRASLVGNEYLRKAREVYTNFNGTAAGAVGPMEATTASYGGVKPMVAGFFGELNDGFEAFLGEVAEVGVRQLQDAL